MEEVCLRSHAVDESALILLTCARHKGSSLRHSRHLWTTAVQHRPRRYWPRTCLLWPTPSKRRAVVHILAHAALVKKGHVIIFERVIAAYTERRLFGPLVHQSSLRKDGLYVWYGRLRWHAVD